MFFRLRACSFSLDERPRRPNKPRWLVSPIEHALHGKNMYSFQYWTKIYWATPPWISKYIPIMRRLYETTPKGHQLDHIVPLKSDLVCGLHVPWNFQHLPRLVNQHKSNRMWPGHPNENHELFPLETEQDLFEGLRLIPWL